MRRAIARAMNDAKPGIPHIYVTVEVDMGAAMKLRQQINESGAAAVKVSVNDLVVKAAAKALAKLPVVNTSFATTSEGQPGVVRTIAAADKAGARENHEYVLSEAPCREVFEEPICILQGDLRALPR